MRLWSIHPKYLDTKGLIALWREALLARRVLEGYTKGYKNHPQLFRFRNSPDPIYLINEYLYFILEESKNRNFIFDSSKINFVDKYDYYISVTKGQVQYEQMHLLNKLKKRNKQLYSTLLEIKLFDVHPIFKIVEGEIEQWEKIK